MWNVDLTQIGKTGHIKAQVILREMEDIRRWIELKYSLYKNTYRILKPVGTTIRRGLK
jgi:hypothetical protein